MKIFSFLIFSFSFVIAFNASAMDITFITGDVSITRGSQKITKIAVGDKLKENDVIKTGKKAAANIAYSDRSEIRMGENSSVKLGREEGNGDTPATVLGGSVSTKFNKLSKDSGAKKVYTPSTVCAVRGTEFKVIVSDTAASRVELTEGTLDVYNPSGGGKIQAGTSMEANAGIAPVKSDPKPVSADEWSAAKDSEFDADVPQRSQRFKKQTEDFAASGEQSKKDMDKLKRDISEKKNDKDALEKTGEDLNKQSEKVEDNYYQSDAATSAIDKITNRFSQDKAKMRAEFEKLKRESNKVSEQQKRNFEAIQAVKESYKKAYEAIKNKFEQDKQNIKGNVDLNKVKPTFEKK